MMIDSPDIIEYDGSYEGFLCCVNAVFKSKQLPAVIASSAELTQTLFIGQFIETDDLLAAKIEHRLKTVLSPDNRQLLKKGFLTQLPEKERALIIALDTALTFGDSIERHTYHPDIQRLVKAIRQLAGEVHLYEGFVRFTEVNQTLVATIAPHHYVLPFLMPFFSQRFANESFMIYDKTFQLLGSYHKHKITIDAISEMPDVPVSDNEQAIQQQWQTFFDTVAITERLNPLGQQSQMPKRFWSELTEMKGFL